MYALRKHLVQAPKDSRCQVVWAPPKASQRLVSIFTPTHHGWPFSIGIFGRRVLHTDTNGGSDR